MQVASEKAELQNNYTSGDIAKRRATELELEIYKREQIINERKQKISI